MTDPPVVKLRLGSSLAAGDIKEGDDVYFECHVRANPPARKLSWLHDVSTINIVTQVKEINGWKLMDGNLTMFKLLQ